MSLSVTQHEISQRQGMIALGTNVYLRSESLIENLKNELIAILATNDEKEAVRNSFEKLRAVAHSLMGDESYIRRENPHTFKDYMEDLKNALKIIFSGIPPNRGTEENLPDHIDFLKKNFFESLENERGGRFIPQVYAPITQVVRFLRNVEEHGNRPVDHITGKRSYGNLYTLVSIFVLVTYAYKEILEVWLETKRQSRRRV